MLKKIFLNVSLFIFCNFFSMEGSKKKGLISVEDFFKKYYGKKIGFFGSSELAITNFIKGLDPKFDLGKNIEFITINGKLIFRAKYINSGKIKNKKNKENKNFVIVEVNMPEYFKK